MTSAEKKDRRVLYAVSISGRRRCEEENERATTSRGTGDYEPWYGRLSQNTSNGSVGDADGVPDMISASSRIPLEALDVPYRVWSRQSAGSTNRPNQHTEADQPTTRPR